MWLTAQVIVQKWEVKFFLEKLKLNNPEKTDHSELSKNGIIYKIIQIPYL